MKILAYVQRCDDGLLLLSPWASNVQVLLTWQKAPVQFDLSEMTLLSFAASIRIFTKNPPATANQAFQPPSGA